MRQRWNNYVEIHREPTGSKKKPECMHSGPERTRLERQWRPSRQGDAELQRELDAGGSGKTELPGGLADSAFVTTQGGQDHPPLQLLARFLECLGQGLAILRGRIQTGPQKPGSQLPKRAGARMRKGGGKVRFHGIFRGVKPI
jgi:hypothetical protein